MLKFGLNGINITSLICQWVNWVFRKYLLVQPKYRSAKALYCSWSNLFCHKVKAAETVTELHFTAGIHTGGQSEPDASPESYPVYEKVL